MPQKNQYLKEMNKIKIKDNVIANIEKTIKRLEEENSAAKRSIIPNTYIYISEKLSENLEFQLQKCNNETTRK